jgi:hypothetical protein
LVDCKRLRLVEPIGFIAEVAAVEAAVEAAVVEVPAAATVGAAGAFLTFLAVTTAWCAAALPGAEVPPLQRGGGVGVELLLESGLFILAVAATVEVGLEVLEVVWLLSSRLASVWGRSSGDRDDSTSGNA